LEDGYQYSARMEIVRPTAISSDGTYHYQIKAWVLRLDQPAPGTSSNATALQTSHLEDVMVPFSDFTPQINTTVNIYPNDHNAFNTIFFGFTEATGAYTQQIMVTNFEAFFPQSTCSSPTPTISPTSATFSGGSGSVISGSVSVAPSSTCPWQASSTVSWITITSGSYGTGNGMVNYTVAPPNACAQTGYIDIAGATFTVYQNPLSITTASPLPNGIHNTNYSTPVTANGGLTPYTWSASGLPRGFKIDPSSGTISGMTSNSGTYTPTITVTDSCNLSNFSKQFTLTIN
jgi:hypothetical protein